MKTRAQYDAEFAAAEVQEKANDEKIRKETAIYLASLSKTSDEDIAGYAFFLACRINPKPGMAIDTNVQMCRPAPDFFGNRIFQTFLTRRNMNELRVQEVTFLKRITAALRKICKENGWESTLYFNEFGFALH